MTEIDGKGQMIAGRYRLEERLGAGGMGIVWRARDQKLDRDVAVKLLPPAAIGDGAARLRLLREARAAAKLEHPNIVHMYDVGETDDGGAFLVMELVRGRPFSALLKSESVALETRMQVLVQVARALAFAHREGFVHRDIKPDNVMVRDDGRPVVLDFGVAKVVDASAGEITLTSEGAIVGTPAYLSPEQARGEAVDGRADQWALAVMTFEALTGHLPWEQTSVAGMLAAILTEPAPPIRSRNPELPERVEQTLLRAMSKASADRFSDCDAVAEALSSTVVSGSVSQRQSDSDTALAATLASDPGAVATPAPTVARTSSKTPEPIARSAAIEPPRRNRWLVPAAAVALACVGVGTALRLRSHRTKPAAIAPRSPLFAANARVACPLLEATGVPAPTGWLGAAAAFNVCNQVSLTTLWTGDSLITPAQLLSLPRRPDESMPEEPYAAADARARSIAAARARADAYFDGSIARDDRGFTVELDLKDRAGHSLAHATGHGEVVYLAVDEAVHDLAERRFIPAPPLTPGARERSGVSSLRALRASNRVMNDFAQTSSHAHEHCRELRSFANEVGGNIAGMLRMCALLDGTTPDVSPPAPIDPASSPWEVARSVGPQALLARPEDLPELLRLTNEAARTATDTALRATLFRDRSVVEYRLGHGDAAREAALHAVDLEPTSIGSWNILQVQSGARPEYPFVLRGVRAWMPWVAQSWSGDSPGNTPSERAHAIEVFRRANILAPAADDAAHVLAYALIGAGHETDARDIALRFAESSPDRRVTADGLLVTVDFALAHFDEGLRRANATLDAQPSPPAQPTAELMLALGAFPGAYVMGRVPALIERVVTRFLDPEPVLVRRVDQALPVQLAGACLYGAPAVARRCVERLHGLLETHYFDGVAPGTPEFVDGALAYVHGDLAGAARSWRALLADVPDLAAAAPTLMAETFDHANEPELADRVYEIVAREQPTMHGAEWWYPAAAHRFAARGDHERAQQLATAVVRAWSLADVQVATVAEMRSLR